jgi:hypothetical protein
MTRILSQFLGVVVPLIEQLKYRKDQEFQDTARLKKY